MSVLTWHDVAQPNFGPASEAAANATQALNNAFGAASGALSQFKDAQTTAADRAIQERALSYQDPASLQAALANGTIVGPDGAHAGVSFLGDLNNQAGTLIKNSLTQAQTGLTGADTSNVAANTSATNTNTDQAAILNQRANQIYGANTALAPVVSGLVAKYAPNGAMGVTPAFSELDQNPDFQKLAPADQDTIKSHLVSGINASVAGTNFVFGGQVAGADAQNNFMAQNEIARITAPGGQFGTDESRFKEAQNIANPEVRAKVMAALNPSSIPTTPSEIAINRTLLGGVGDSFDPATQRFMSPGTPTPDKPIMGAAGQAMTFGEATAFGNKMKAANGVYVKDEHGNVITDSNGNPEGSSAQTPYMMINSTRNAAAQALWNSDPAFRASTPGATSWDQVAQTPENIDKVVNYTIADGLKNGTLGQIWKTLTPDDLQTIKAASDNGGDPYGTARALIIARENGGSLDTIVKRMSNMNMLRQQSNTGLDTEAATNPLVANYSKWQAANIGGDKNAAAAFLAGGTLSPDLKGADQESLRGNLQTIVDRSQAAGHPINYAQAAQVLAESGQHSNWWRGQLSTIHNILHPDNQISVTNNSIPNLDTIDELTKRIADPSLPSQAQAYDTQRMQQGMTQLTDADFANKMTTFRTLETNFKQNPTPQNRLLYANGLSNLMGSSATQAQVDAGNYNRTNPTPAVVPTGRAAEILNNATAPVQPTQIGTRAGFPIYQKPAPPPAVQSILDQTLGSGPSSISTLPIGVHPALPASLRNARLDAILRSR